MPRALLVVRDLSFVYNGLLITEPKILPAAGGKKIRIQIQVAENKAILVWNNSCLLKNNLLSGFTVQILKFMSINTPQDLGKILGGK